ncbi:protein YgfX [Immundisolibacter sp.]|jgi:hypothetical protein|uniref:protein YgfX n=1 Tax=Immundisolibacter sp. TaxID=1934948 RepID=UPI003F87CDB1
MHVGALTVALGALPLSAWPLPVVVLVSAFGWTQAPKAADVVRLRGRVDDAWTLLRRDGGVEEGWRLVPDACFCRPWLVIVALRRGRRRRYVPLAADAVAPEALRRLRVSLLSGG